MLQYEQIEFLGISRQNYRQKRPKALVITRYSIFLSLSYILYEIFIKVVIQGGAIGWTMNQNGC